MNRLKLAGTWFLQIVLALLFILSGSGKFFGMAEVWARHFAGWGYPDGFSYLIGALEVLGGLALLVPMTAGLGAAGLAVIMAGAISTHALHSEPFWGPLIFGGLLGVLAFLRRPPWAERWFRKARA